MKRGFIIENVLALQVQQHCIQCGVCMGNYFCSECKFFDDDVSRLVQFPLKLLVLLLIYLHCHERLSFSRSQKISTIVMNVVSAGSALFLGFALPFFIISIKET